MSLKQKLAEKLGISADRIPGSYQIIGDVLLVKFPKLLKLPAKEKKALANAVLELLHHVRLVCESKGVSGELRKPNIKILAFRKGKSKSLETNHKENDILYKLDISKIMFSKGNVNERSRLIKQITPNETIVDMFAGIGYFSLGLAKNSPAKQIYAIEKNNVSFRYLKENIKLNKVKNIKPILGDCRKVKKAIKADRVIMGYFPGTQKFLSSAFRFLKRKGVIHYHNIYKENELWKKPLDEIEKAANQSGYRIMALFGKNLVKSYAPRVWHISIDVEVEKVK